MALHDDQPVQRIPIDIRFDNNIGFFPDRTAILPPNLLGYSKHLAEQNCDLCRDRH